MQTLDIQLPCPACHGTGSVRPEPSDAYKAAVKAHRGARQALEDYLESHNPNPFGDEYEYRCAIEENSRLTARCKRTQDAMRAAQREDEARPSIPCPACHGTGKITHTVDLARAVSTLFEYVARHERDMSEGYPDALRDLLDESKQESA